MASRIQDPVYRQRQLEHAFGLLDERKTGKISKGNLHSMVRQCRLDIADKDIQSMIEEFDLDGDGSCMFLYPNLTT